MPPIDHKSESASPLVSICVPTFNGSQHIVETITSALASSYSNLEVVVSDDASTDGTGECVARIRDDRVKYSRSEDRLGVPRNWNRAIEGASGAYVCLLNHDDLIGPFWLSFAVHHLERQARIGWVATASRIISRTGVTLAIDRRFPHSGPYSPQEAFPNVAMRGALAPVYLTRRHLLAELGRYGEDDGPFADHILHLRLAAGFPLYYSSNPLHAAWRVHSENLTHQVQSSDLGIRLTECLVNLHKVAAAEGFPAGLRGAALQVCACLLDQIMERCRELARTEDHAGLRRVLERVPSQLGDIWKP